MTHNVSYSETAWQDFDEIYDWIADNADPLAADRYLRRILDFCSTLRDFPHRGAQRDDLAPGVRTIVFEGRALIAYTVEAKSVRIVRILSRGRDAELAFTR